MAATVAARITDEKEHIEKPEQEEAPATEEPVQLSEDEVHEKLMAQIGYYFSRENIVKDRFLLSQMTNRMQCPVDLLMTFPRITALSTNVDDVIKAVKKLRLVYDDNTRLVGPRIPIPRTSTLVITSLSMADTVETVTALFDEFEHKPTSIQRQFTGAYYAEFTEPAHVMAVIEKHGRDGIHRPDRVVQVAAKAVNPMQEYLQAAAKDGLTVASINPYSTVQYVRPDKRKTKRDKGDKKGRGSDRRQTKKKTTSQASTEKQQGTVHHGNPAHFPELGSSRSAAAAESGYGNASFTKYDIKTVSAVVTAEGDALPAGESGPARSAEPRAAWPLAQWITAREKKEKRVPKKERKEKAKKEPQTKDKAVAEVAEAVKAVEIEAPAPKEE